MRNFFIRIMAYLSGEFIRRSKISLDERKYKKAFRYLDYSEKLANLVGSSLLLNPLTTTQRLELNFLTHNLQYVLDNIEIPINAVEKTKLDWSQADRDYLKMYNYNFVLLCYIFLDDGDKALETYNHVYALLDKDVSEKMVGCYPLYTKERLKNLFESEPYYAKNYSEETIDNVYEFSELLWGR